jgi:glycosyltransferase involved in cell wall biosynthesis
MSSPAPVVSIITPAYNAAPFLAQTISSALAQTFGDFELLISDDGSTDHSFEIACAWARLDPRVRALTGPNRGSSSARNRAMGEARGKYFALLDSDDLWLPDFLKAQLDVFRRYTDADVVTANAYNLGGPRHGQLLNPPASGYRRLSLLEMIEHENSVCIMSVFRRSVVERVGGFDEAVLHNEDYDFWLRAVQAGCQFVVNPEPLAWYRRRPESKSADEAAALAGIIKVLHRARVRCADMPAEGAAIDRQLVRFERQRLFARAKAHLLRREFDAAARAFEALSALSHDFGARAMALISRQSPQALLFAYQLKAAFRTARPLLRVW